MKVYLLFICQKYEPSLLAGVFDSLQKIEDAKSRFELTEDRYFSVNTVVINEKLDLVCV